MIPEKIEKILELARWAPSGDNTQPWRFEIVSESHFVIHGYDTRDWCVYDLDGHASQIAIGTLVENIAIAASDLGLRAEFRRQRDQPETTPTIDVKLIGDVGIARDPLVDFLRHRVTQRRPLSTMPLTPVQKQRLEDSVGPEYSVTWIEGAANRWRLARLLSRSAKIRLTIPEAYEVHRQIIEWNTQTSDDRIPDKAAGLDPVGLKLMRWAMASWSRVDFLNRYLAGTWLPRLQLDLLPGFFCGAHFLISAREVPKSVDDFLDAGRAIQRFWLTTAQQGLQFQPEMTPLIFSRFSELGIVFTEKSAARRLANELSEQLASLFGNNPNRAVFMGRIGAGGSPRSRSTRRPLRELVLNQ
ncbi:MAG TPA: nitroreductase family protein [Gammaproteobacteria bacterium]|nr:nitroreductase family protein [Gammaproteobacteria bacterium]